MKFVRQESRPICGDTGLRALEQQVADEELPAAAKVSGKVESLEITEE